MLDDVCLICIDRFHQSSASLLITGIDICALGNKVINNFEFAEECCTHQSGAASVIMRVDICAGMFKHLADGKMSFLCGTHQRCLIIFVPRSGVGAIVEQVTDNVLMTPLGAPHQGSAAVSVGDVYICAFGNHRADLFEVASCRCIKEFLINLIHKFNLLNIL